ncbi:MAG: SCO family protein [Aestuariivirgaceae bacterium]
MRRWLRRAGLAAMLVLAGSGFGHSTTPPALESLFGGPFSLTDHTGVQRSDQDYRGKFMLIYFGYTTCPSICPANLQHMADALDRLGDKAAGIVPIFISIDPGRDRPEVIKEYVGHFGDGFVGLTGSETDVRAVAKAYRVHRRKVVEKDAAPQDYLVDHASITYLMGPDGKFRTLFPHNTPGETIAERITGHLAE